ncbi:MAG: HAD hydrolase-like protein [Deltaproteobacteria bacterium]|nr:HAD hydrolase-like protein [Deltaproteobacteria bacterium]
MARLILFDVDGTLIRSRNGYVPFNLAIERTFGIAGDIRTVIPDGNTDPIILEDIFAAANHEVEITEEHWETFAKNLHRSYAETIGQGVTTLMSLPGVLELVQELDRREGIHQGVVTGNLEVTGKLKLEAVGLHSFLTLGAYGSDSRHRGDLPKIARERWELALGVSLEPEDCVIVGDTPKDLAAARQNGMKCLLVGTGRYPVEELRLFEPDAVLPDFTDTEATVEALLSCPVEPRR